MFRKIPRFSTHRPPYLQARFASVRGRPPRQMAPVDPPVINQIDPHIQQFQSRLEILEHRFEEAHTKILERVEAVEKSLPLPGQQLPQPGLPPRQPPKTLEEDLVQDSFVKTILEQFEYVLQSNARLNREGAMKKYFIVFEGNPGVGKMTAARLLAMKFHQHGTLKYPYVLRMTTEEMCNMMDGGQNFEPLLAENVLYVDQADRAWEKFGVNYFHNFLNKLQELPAGVVIFSCAPGAYHKLTARSPVFQELFPTVFDLPNYKEHQLKEIVTKTLSRYALKLGDEVEARFDELVLNPISSSDLKKKNAHILVGMAESAAFNHLRNTAKNQSWDSFGQLSPADFKSLATKDLPPQLAEIDELIGLPDVKLFAHSLYQRVISELRRGQKTTRGMNLLFVGNSGTGKTTVARLISKMLYTLGYTTKELPTFVGLEGSRIKEHFDIANGGVLVIEDVSQLGALDTSFYPILSTLIQAGEHEVVLIVTDTTKNVEKLFTSSPGLQAYFQTKIFFPDFTPKELSTLAKNQFEKSGYTLAPASEALLDQQINMSNYGLNALFAKQLVSQTLLRQGTRAADTEDFVVLPEDFSAASLMNPSEVIFSELDALIGLNKVKTFVRDLYAQARTNQERRRRGIIKAESETLHMAFKGNPGTGKTTVALLIAKLLKSLNILSTGQLVVASRDDFISSYEGGTSQKTREIIQSAMGGVLFIDEAYSLAQDEHDFFGHLVITTIVDEMEKRRRDLVIVMAGYTKEMTKMLNINPGLKSRMPHEIVFDDFSSIEQTAIAKSMFARQEYKLSPEADKKLENMLKGSKVDGNARGVRHLVSKLVKHQNLRLSKNLDASEIQESEFLEIQESDFKDPHYGETNPAPLLEELDRFTGLGNVKEFVHSLHARMVVSNARLEAGLEGTKNINSFHMVFKGNPGTGKTMIALLMAKLLHSVGVIPSPQLVVAKRDDMVAQYLGQTEHRTKHLIQSAIGGVLFIDEVYALTSDEFGRVALTVLLDMMEQHRNELVVIVAGYPKEMDSFISSNPGFMSRFIHRMDFKNYSGEELLAIANDMFKAESYELDEEATEKLKAVTVAQLPGNARDVRNIVSKVVLKHNMRVAKLDSRDVKSLTVITGADFEGVSASEKPTFNKYIL